MKTFDPVEKFDCCHFCMPKGYSMCGVAKTYVIEGDPIPLARPRFGHNKVWDAQKHQKAEIALLLQAQHQSKKLYAGPLHVDIFFFLPTPKKTRKEDSNILHISRPDLDNLVKLILDVGLDVLYKDDSIVASIRTTKCYSSKPRTEFTISELKRL